MSQDTAAEWARVEWAWERRRRLAEAQGTLLVVVESSRLLRRRLEHAEKRMERARVAFERSRRVAAARLEALGAALDAAEAVAEQVGRIAGEVP